MRRTMLAFALSALMISAAQATLIDRGNGLIYDSELQITWMQDANLAASNGFGVAGIGPHGLMDWYETNSWIQAMNTANYLGFSDWRLPVAKPINGSDFNYALSYDGSTDFGAHITSRNNEMAYLYTVNLGNPGYWTTTGEPNGCGYPCTPNKGPFINIGADLSDYLGPGYYGGAYATGTMVPQSPELLWSFGMTDGASNFGEKVPTVGYLAWAVRDGDVLVASVPEPETYSMMIVGLALIGFLGRRRSRG